MKRPLLTLILFAALLFDPSFSASEDRSDPLQHIYSQEVKRTVLDNGLVVIIKEAPSTGLVSLDLRVASGSAQEGEFSGSGIAHFVEHMIFKGASKKRPGGIEKEIRAHGGTINGGTSYDYTSFYITIPKENFPLALEALSDSVLNPLMHSRDVGREKNVILKEIRLNKDDPMRLISRLLWNTVFTKHPYRHPVIGYESVFRELSAEDLSKFHSRMYVPNNMVLAIVGDIKYSHALNEVKKSFLPYRRRSLEPKAMPEESPQRSKRTLHIKKDLEMAYFALGYRSVDIFSEDMPALDVLSAILGQGSSSRLNLSLYRKKNLVYSIGAWNYTPKDPGIFIISGMADPEKLEAALGALSEEINIIKKGAIDVEELERVKAMVIAEHVYSLEVLSGQAGELAVNEMTAGEVNFSKDYVKKIAAVVPDRIIEVASKYLNDDSLSLVTISSHDGPAAKEKEALKETKIEKITLPNGLRCLLMEKRDTPSVSMLACFEGGLRAETEENAGISNMTSLMMLKGTASRDENEISAIVENMGAGLSYFSGYNTFGLTLDLLSRDIDKGLDIFEDLLLRPAFPENILQREKDTVRALIDSTDDDIYNAGMKAFRESLFKRHPYRFQNIGTTESVEGLSRSDLEAFYKKYIVPNNMVIAIFGDIDKESLRKRLTDDFSRLEKGPPPEFTRVVEPDQRGITENTLDLQKEQSLVVLGFKGTTIKNRDRYALQLISAALSGVSGRLSAKLRDRLGLAYAVGSFSIPAVDPGYFASFAATTQKHIETAKKELLEQVKALNTKGLTEEELRTAKSELKGNLLIGLQTNSSLAHHAALDEMYGLGFDNYKKYGEYIDSVTNNEIIGASRRYLKPETFTLTVIKGVGAKQSLTER
ncbi:MAG: pitrilysin family protein [Candidatus Omnitrophota bacterium]